MRCNASAAAIVAGDLAQKYGESTRKEQALVNAFIPRSPPGEGMPYFLCFGCSSLLVSKTW
jgi:hypothetical protein